MAVVQVVAGEEAASVAAEVAENHDLSRSPAAARSDGNVVAKYACASSTAAETFFVVMRIHRDWLQITAAARCDEGLLETSAVASSSTAEGEVEVRPFPSPRQFSHLTSPILVDEIGAEDCGFETIDEERCASTHSTW